MKGKEGDSPLTSKEEIATQLCPAVATSVPGAEGILPLPVRREMDYSWLRSKQNVTGSVGTQKVARLGLLLAMAVGLQVFEGQLPSLPIPGAKLGLANLVSLLIILLWGWREAMLVVVTRQFLGSLATGTFLSTSFFFGLAGGVTSVVTMSLAASSHKARLSPIGISLIGAITHNCTQLLVAWAITSVPAILGYLPFLLWFSLPAGALVGALAQLLWPRLAHLNQVAQAPGTATEDEPQRRQGLFRRFTLADTGVAVMVALVAVGLTMLRQAQTVPVAHPVAVIAVNGQVKEQIPLDQNRQLLLDVNGGHMIIETIPGKVRVLTSTCPDKICVRTGWISATSQAIVCVPYRTVIRIQGGQPADYDVISS